MDMTILASRLRSYFLFAVCCSIVLMLSMGTGTNTALASGGVHYQGLLKVSSEGHYAPAPANTAVTTYHNDNMRTGQDLHETTLTTSSVNASSFGRRVTYPVDGFVYAQPLYIPNLTINGSLHNVVLVATENDSVYTFDADQNLPIGGQLWHHSFLNLPNVTTIPSSDAYYPGDTNPDLAPQIGITGTPVIDTSTNTLYVVAATKENGQYFQRLHALDLSTGNEKPNSPVTIQASVPGTGAGSQNGQVSFNPLLNDQRPALLLQNGVVYITWSSFGDRNPYHGWIIGYNSSTLQQVAVYNDTPNGTQGGIWMSGSGLATDASGNMYVNIGNGTFDLNNNGKDAGDSILKLNPQNNLAVTDSFTPFNQSCLNAVDADLGSSGTLILPDQTGTSHPHLLIAGGKEGRVYVIDRDNMGRFTSDPSLNCNTSEKDRTDIDHVVQETAPGTIKLFSTPAYYAGEGNSGPFVYMGGINNTLRAYSLHNNQLSSNPTSTSAETYSFTGATPSISSNSNAVGSGIVWTISPADCYTPGCTPTTYSALRAYSATNLGQELYNSEQNAAQDRLTSYVKFTTPTVANGEVFVGTQNSLEIFGLRTFPPTTIIDDSVQGSGLNQFNYIGNWQHCSMCSTTDQPLYNGTASTSSNANGISFMVF
jgi:hypothetical protein